MPRPRCCRRISGRPACKMFKPMGIPVSGLEVVELTLDEYEAIRLADHEGLYQEQAAGQMGVSRQTFGRTVECARRKVARALVLGLALAIEAREGEPGIRSGVRSFLCSACGHGWTEPFGTGRPEGCPSCSGQHFHRAGCASGSRCSDQSGSGQPGSGQSGPGQSGGGHSG